MLVEKLSVFLFAVPGVAGVIADHVTAAGSGNEQPACVTTWYRYSSWPHERFTFRSPQPAWIDPQRRVESRIGVHRGFAPETRA